MQQSNSRRCFFWPIILETRHSAHNKLLEVTLKNGSLVLDTTGANYSFGALHKVMRKALKRVSKGEVVNWQNVLILVYGGGSAASIIRSKYSHAAHITAVEIDPNVAVDFEKISKYASSFSKSIVEFSDIEEDQLLVLLISRNYEGYFSTDDQENLLLNRLGKPVLCI